MVLKRRRIVVLLGCDFDKRIINSGVWGSGSQHFYLIVITYSMGCDTKKVEK